MAENSSNRCAAPTATGERCKRRVAPGEKLCGPHLRRAHGAFTAARADLLVAALSAGNALAASARAVGISDRTLREWLRLGGQGVVPYAEFAERVKTARMQGEVSRVTQIATAAAEDWRASAWLLDHRYPDHEQLLDTTELAERAAAEAREEAEATLLSIGEPLTMSRGAVARYADAVAAWTALTAQWEHLGRPGTALGGATGQAEVPHPLLAQIALARREASQLATLLGLDPLGRLKLARHIGAGRPPGAASAPDRAAGPPRRRLAVVE